MYYAQTTRERIKLLCKEKKISMELMLSELNLGVNAIRQINDVKGMASFSLAKIADYLDCSVDYLLGRTDRPNTAGNHTIDFSLSSAQKIPPDMFNLISSLDDEDMIELRGTVKQMLRAEKYQQDASLA